MNKLLKRIACAGAVLLAGSAVAGVYDDCQYLFRGTYQWKGSTSQAFVEECANALTLGNGTPDTATGWGFAGAQRQFIQHKVSDVVCPYARRTLKNRSSLYFAQPTYKNPGDDTLYGYSVRGQFTAPFSSNFTNAYTIILRYRHEGKISPSSTETALFNFGYGWSPNRGLAVYLRGDDDNQYLYIMQGKSYNTDFKAMQNSADTRLSSGKWVDLAICRDASKTSESLCLYTCVEGGKICKQTGYSGYAAPTSESTLFMIPAGESSDSQSCAGTTNTPATAASMIDKFRGSFQKIAMWKRKLTDDEVKAAFSEDLAGGDLLRLGVDNGNALEFTARNEATKAAVTETDADQATDWRYFNATLTPANKTATVLFSVAADGLVSNRTLTVKATTDSCATATLSATLNGAALATAAVSLPAGGAAAFSVPWTALKVGANVLTLTREDAGTDALKVDSLLLGSAVPVTDTPRAAANDVYSSALGWWRHALDVNGDGSFSNMTGYPNVLLARDADKSDASHIWGRTVASNYQVHAVSVTCPASGTVLENEKCVYFRTLVWTNEANEVKNVHGALYRYTYSSQILDNPSNYTILARIKIENFPNPVATSLMGLGFGGNRGIGLDVRPEKGDYTNLRAYVWKGGGAGSCAATLTGDVRDRLSIGKWIDYAMTVSNHTVRLYTYVEGGTGLIEQESGSTKNCDAMSSAAVTFGKYDVADGKPGSGLPCTLRGWLHNAAVWGRALNRDEVLKAMAWPRPDVVRLGVADKTANEFADATVSSFAVPANGDFAAASPALLAPGDSYTVTFDLPAAERNRNQLVRLSAIGEGLSHPIGITVNGLVVTNILDSGEKIWRFAPDADGFYEAGLSRRWLKDGANTVTVTDFADSDATGVLRIDSLVIGNGGERVRVRTDAGLCIIVR